MPTLATEAPIGHDATDHIHLGTAGTCQHCHRFLLPVLFPTTVANIGNNKASAYSPDWLLLFLETDLLTPSLLLEIGTDPPTSP